MKKQTNKIPVTILTGFLGSGKTTLLNHILTEKHGMKIAVIENEFGEVGVDEHLVKQNVYSEEQVIETMNGCICCTVRGDLSKILKKLLVQEKRTFDGIIIQTTGMADPAPVAQTFFVDEVVMKYTTLDGIITVVDAKHIIQHLREEKAQGVQNESIEQIAFADKIILNKTDLVSKEEIEEVIKEIKGINLEVQIIKAQFSKVEPEKIIGIQSFKLNKVLEMDPQFLNIDQQHIHDQSVSSCGCIIQEPISLGKLQNWISQLIQTKSTDLYRYKGVINVVGMDQPYVFQGVHMLFSGTFLKNGWQETKKRQTHFCFIGKNIDREFLINGFKNCIADRLRFNVGDKVQCKVAAGPNGWREGVIIVEWDEGNPYRVKLENGDEVHCPDDSPQLIKLKQKAAAPLSQIFLQQFLDAEERKNKGNELFVLQKYIEAIQAYESGREILEKRFYGNQLEKNGVIGLLYEKLLKNICLCLLRCEKYNQCIQLCNKVLIKLKEDSKCLYMRGQAFMGLNKYQKARESFEQGLKYGENKQIRSALEKCNKKLGE